MNENHLNFTLSEADQKTFIEAVKTINTLIEPFKVVLTDKDRRTLPKMSDGTVPFAEKAASYAVSHPEFKPDYVDADILALNLQGFKLSRKLLTPLLQLVRKLEDISISSGSETYSSSLSYYRNVQVQALDKREGAKVVYEDMQQRFIHQGHKGGNNDSKT